MKQNAEIRIKTTTEIKDKLQSKASEVGMSLKSYLLYVGLNTQIKINVE